MSISSTSVPTKNVRKPQEMEHWREVFQHQNDVVIKKNIPLNIILGIDKCPLDLLLFFFSILHGFLAEIR